MTSYFKYRVSTCWVSPPPHSIARLLVPLISQKKLEIAGYYSLFLLYYRTQQTHSQARPTVVSRFNLKAITNADKQFATLSFQLF